LVRWVFPVVGDEAADLVLNAAVLVLLWGIHRGLSQGFDLGFALFGLAPILKTALSDHSCEIDSATNVR
jgi:hypothetical protein